MQSYSKKTHCLGAAPLLHLLAQYEVNQGQMVTEPVLKLSDFGMSKHLSRITTHTQVVSIYCWVACAAKGRLCGLCATAIRSV